ARTGNLIPELYHQGVDNYHLTLKDFGTFCPLLTLSNNHDPRVIPNNLPPDNLHAFTNQGNLRPGHPPDLDPHTRDTQSYSRTNWELPTGPHGP
ncbi:Hypothetical predicted protein, partial [Pelobates cultripes]